MTARLGVVATACVGPVLLGCRDVSAPVSEQCMSGYADVCFEAALDAHTQADRRHLFERGYELKDPLSRVYVRDLRGEPWGDLVPAEQAQRAVHAYGVWCSRGKVAACYEVGNWLAFDFASPAAAVAPYEVACAANFEDACDRAKQARFAAERLENKPMPSINR